MCERVRSGSVGWGNALQAWSSQAWPSGKVIVIFHCRNPSGSTVTLGLTQLLTEMSTRDISWGVKAGGAEG